MDNDEIVWIIIAAVVVLALLAALADVLSKRKKQRDQQRDHAHAEHLRQQALTHQPAVTESNLDARRAEAEAELARTEAERAERRAAEARQASAVTEAQQEDVVRRADSIDPHVDHRSDGYTPVTPAHDTQGTHDTTGTHGTTGSTEHDVPGRHRDA